MTPAIDYLSDYNINFLNSNPFLNKRLKEEPVLEEEISLKFKKIEHKDMPEIWEFLKNEKGRTTDFSYGGILMWVDFFKYEYAIFQNTLFIKGVVENDISKPAFSLPIGELPLQTSLNILKDYCKKNSIMLEFSAVPEYALEEMKNLQPSNVEELTDWGDYLYPAENLATLRGKKMAKKRNHVNNFNAHYPDFKFEVLTEENAEECLNFMDIFEKEGDNTEMAAAERNLSRFLINKIKEGDDNLKGAVLYVGDEIAAYTIGDIKGDTLFIHVEKALRKFGGSYETINYLFAKQMTEQFPEIQFINREDDAGDEGLRRAKESYHPCEILRKYNIIFQ